MTWVKRFQASIPTRGVPLPSRWCVSPNGAGGLLSRFLEHLKSLRVQSVMVTFAYGFGLQPSCACRRHTHGAAYHEAPGASRLHLDPMAK